MFVTISITLLKHTSLLLYCLHYLTHTLATTGLGDKSVMKYKLAFQSLPLHHQFLLVIFINAMLTISNTFAFSLFCFSFSSHCSAYERKPPVGFKPLTPPSTPVSPCSSATSHPMHKQTPPLLHNSAIGQHTIHGQPGLTNSSLNQRTIPLPSQTPPFVVPCPPLNRNSHFNNEHR